MPQSQTIQQRFSAWAADELRPTAITNSLLAGLLIAILEVPVVISFAALVFGGKLAPFLPEVIGFIIIGDVILIAVLTALSSYSGTIGMAQDTPAAVLGAGAVAVVAALPALAATQHFATVVLMLVLTSLLTGLVFLLLGIFKLGGLARFLPYPVMGGFLAGTGWLLVWGGVTVLVTVPFGPQWFSGLIVWQWLPAVLLGVFIYAAVTRFPRSWLLPVLLALSVGVFYFIAGLNNISVAQLEADGWLVGTLAAGQTFSFPWSTEIWTQVEWAVLWAQIPNLAPAAIISVIALLLNSSSIELVIKKDIDLNRELVAAGVGNLLSGVVGGLPGYQAISISAMNHKLTSGKRLTGYFTALILTVLLVFGTTAIQYTPKIVLGAVLVYVGVAMLVEWVYEAWFKFARIDFVIILAILGVIIFSGFLNGLIFGLVLAIILFVVSYSRVSVVKYALSGREYRSRVTRSPRQRQVLEAHGDQIYLLKLEGFIFFGTADSIFAQVRANLLQRPARFVLIDFAQVSGLDSTGLLSFRRMWQWCQEQNTVLAFTDLNGRAQSQFAREGFREQAGSLYFFVDLDHGVEWCENQILAEEVTLDGTEPNLTAELQAIVSGQRGVEKLLTYMQRKTYAAGEYLMRQGDEPDTIYFIESGQVTAQLEALERAPVRLETMGRGRTVGELGFYLGNKRTAAVVADKASVIYSLSRSELAEIEKLDAEAANAFHRLVVHLLGERVTHLIRAVDALER